MLRFTTGLAVRARLGRAALVVAAFAALPAHAFDLQAHRGGRGLRPENTLAAFENALRLGVDTLEMDAAITADGVVVISHDPALNPAITRDAQGRWVTARPLIRSLPLADLQAFEFGRIDPASDYGRGFASQQPHDGERMPTLAAVFALVDSLGADRVRFDIETKVFPDHPEWTVDAETFTKKLLEVIRRAGMTKRVMVQSFDWRTLRLVQQLEPGMDTVYLSSRGNLEAGGLWTLGMLTGAYPSVGHMVKAAGGTTWAPSFQTLNAGDVKTAQQLGLKVIPWTVNEPRDIDRLIGWGVDGLISDYPDRVRAAMQKRGLALPASLPAR